MQPSQSQKRKLIKPPGWLRPQTPPPTTQTQQRPAENHVSIASLEVLRLLGVGEEMCCTEGHFELKCSTNSLSQTIPHRRQSHRGPFNSLTVLPHVHVFSLTDQHHTCCDVCGPNTIMSLITDNIGLIHIYLTFVFS